VISRPTPKRPSAAFEAVSRALRRDTAASFGIVDLL
jgi:hypothetical protein